MPLTPSHAAAAWPLRRLAPWLPLDALVLGTMSPDFEYILRLRVYGRFGHTPLGLLLFCLPAGLIACAVFRARVRPALVRHLPAGMRPAPAQHGWLASAAAVVAGAVTHVVWDGFTHGSATFVVRTPMLRDAVAGRFPVYTVLQHLSTLAGAVAVALWVRAWIHSHPPEARRYDPGARAKALRVACGILTVGAFSGIANGAQRAHAGMAPALGYAAVGGMAGLAAALTAYGIASQRNLRRPAP